MELGSWWLRGRLHREDGPAIKWPDGSRVWYLYGNIHRETGPAVEWSNGTRMWYVDGKIQYCEKSTIQ